MTQKELTYVVAYIDKRLGEFFTVQTPTKDAQMRFREFENRVMRDITGQQLLPQTVFRQFLQDLSQSMSELYGTVDSLELHSGTYEELKALQTNAALTAGTWYRMTDFVTTVANDTNARSAGHSFDLLLFATSADSFSSAVGAMPHDGDTYFADCDLAAWEVNYDINNDTTKYKWADETNGKGVITYIKDEHGNVCHYDFKNIQFKRWAITDISSSSLTADALSELKSTYCYDQNGGRCFATKDVHGYWVPSNRDGTESTIDEETSAWYYTFHGLHSSDGETIDEHYDMSVNQYKLTDGCVENMEENESGADTQDLCKDNYIKPAYSEYFLDDEYYKGRQVLNDIVFLNGLSYCYYNEEDEYWEYQTSSCFTNKFGLECKNSTFGNSCYSNTFGNNCYRNTFGNYIRCLTVYEGVLYVSVIGGSNNSAYVQNAQILNGTQGTGSIDKLTITFTANKKATQIAGLNSSNALKIWTPADLT